MEYEYVNRSCCERYPDEAHKLQSLNDPKNVDFVAEDAAEHYFDEEGWEADEWPHDFEIFFEGKSLGICSVEREVRSVFIASAPREGGA